MERIPVVELISPSSLSPSAKLGKIYVRLFSGTFSHLRRLVSWPLLLAYFAIAWFQQEDQPLLLFSFEARRLFFFGWQFGWGDIPLLAGILVVAAFGLFAMAVAWGRVWCGYACPQSVWTWIFLRVEEITEGSAWHRKKQDKKGLTTTLFFRRTCKHLIWCAVAVLTAVTFTGYFVPMSEIFAGLLTAEASVAVWSWILIMAGLTYLNAGLVREKICLHACPYSRFQSVMFDDNTRTVSYDAIRGGAKVMARNDVEEIKQSKTTKGDCVDCELCVQVCPVGIDIREGLQAACIDCGACIDACDSVMDKLNRASGLIGYYSQNMLERRPSPIVRRRLLGYSLVFTLVVAALGTVIAQREQIHTSITRDRNSLFNELPDGSICNSYTVEFESFYSDAKTLSVAVKAMPEAGGFRLSGPKVITLADGRVVTRNYQVCAELSQLQPQGKLQKRITPITFIFSSDGAVIKNATTFIAPFMR